MNKLLPSLITLFLLLISHIALAVNCDRSCLTATITAYLSALEKGDPKLLPLAKDVRFTEDTVKMKLGEGLWASKVKLHGYRQDFIDVKEGVAGAQVILEENGNPVMFVVRLKVSDSNKLSEIETMVVRGSNEGLIFRPDNLVKPTTIMSHRPTPAERNTREDAIAIAKHYPDGLKVGSFVEVDAPFADDAYRFENGQTMAGKGCPERFKGCENIKTQRIPKLSGITSRLAAVDEEMGIVWYRLDFGGGAREGNALIVWEAFKVYGGQIHGVEAFMEMMPKGSDSGWDDIYPRS